MQEKPYERKKLLAVGIVAAVVAVLIVIIVVIMALMSGGGTKPTANSDTSRNPAAILFYNTLSNAAKQSQIRVAMYRATYSSKADADAGKNIGTTASSVAELDLGITKWRSVFATNVADTPNFAIGRCIDGTTYSDDYNATDTPPPTTLETAAEVLKTNQHVHKTSVPIFNPCPQVGVMIEASVDLASFRLSDGMFPVTITAAQAENWKNLAQKADLFTIKDEGMVEQNGRQLKKISFTPKDPINASSRLHEIFSEAGEIDKIQTEHPNAVYKYEFISMNPGNTGGVGGFYLIDEKSKLPVYSELYGTNSDRESSKSSSRFNIARTKQTYDFGKPLSLTDQSPLEIIK